MPEGADPVDGGSTDHGGGSGDGGRSGGGGTAGTDWRPVHDHDARPYGWVGDWSERRAVLSPDAVGLVDATTGDRFTYADLDRRANRAARLLREFGVTGGRDESSGDDPDVGGRVVTLSRNRPELVDLFFATGKTGGVLAPLSHRLAPPELAALLGDVDPPLVVVEEPFDDLATEALTDAGLDPAVRSLPTDGDHRWAPWADDLPADDSPVEAADRSLADAHLFLHTGGSTGTPKETVVTHGSVLWNSFNTITAWGLRPGDVTPMAFPLFHTGGWNVLTVPLFHVGGTVVIAREVAPGDLLRQLDEEDATVFVGVPAVLRMLVEHDDWAATDLSSLRFAKSGGGPARQSVMEAWWDRGVDLSQGYGLTECGPNNFAMPDGWPHGKADSVGVPAPHVDVRIVDDDGDPVEAGRVGELELAGPHAADRYWRNPGESAATFGDGWVSTGDLARRDDEGYLYVVGRKKTMFVSGGENVYPARVEDAVADYPAVAEVVVVPVPDDRWGEVGKAVVELAGDADEGALTLDDLQSFLEGRLAGFEVPRHLAFVDEMPTSGPSKIDREAVEAAFGG